MYSKPICRVKYPVVLSFLLLSTASKSDPVIDILRVRVYRNLINGKIEGVHGIRP